jgi:hypothetical protein
MKYRKWWVEAGLALALGAAAGLALRPYGRGPLETTAVISAMQIIIISGVAWSFIGRMASKSIWSRPLLAMAASGCAVVASCWALLPVTDVTRLVVAAGLWAVFIVGLSVVTAGNRPDRRRLPAIALAVSIILPLWPIVAAPLIGAESHGAIEGVLNFILGLCPSIWIIHITQATTGMNTIGWFHSQLLYRVVPLGQNALIPKTIPWFEMAGGVGVLGLLFIYISAWRRRNAGTRRTDPPGRLASAP